MSNLVDDLLAEGDPEGPDFEAEVLDRLSTLHREFDTFRMLHEGRTVYQDSRIRELRATQLRQSEILQKLLDRTP